MQITGGTAAALPLLQITTARSEDEHKEFVGVTYSGLTHRAQGPSRGEFRWEENTMKGEVKIPGFRIPIESKPVENEYRQDTYYVTKDDDEFTDDDGLPMQIKLIDTGQSITGRITRPTISYGKLAFTMGEKDNGATVERVQSGLAAKGQGRSDVPDQRMPDVGIPPQVNPRVYKNNPAEYRGGAK